MRTKYDYYYRQSAVVPFYEKGGALWIVLITNRSRTKWILPKGIVEKDMSPATSAAKEAFEEGGIRGEVFDEQIACFEHQKWGDTCRVKVFPLEVSELLDEWDEGSVLNGDGRTRQAFEPDAAARLIEPVMRPSLDAFQNWYLSR